MSSWKWYVPAAGVVVSATLWYGVRWWNARAEPTMPLGVSAGGLAACPDSPNCVASASNDPEHQMPALPLRGDPAPAIERLREIVGQLPGSQLTADEGNYLHFEIRTRWLGFIDDVEFLVDPERGQIDFRSASRSGYSDLGVNRARMEQVARDYLRAVDSNK